MLESTNIFVFSLFQSVLRDIIQYIFLIIQCIKVMNGITTAATAYYRTILIIPTSVRCIDFSIKSFGSLREEIIQNLVKQID